MDYEEKLGVTILGEFHDVAQVEPENCQDIYIIYKDTVRYGWLERWNDSSKKIIDKELNSVSWFLYYNPQDTQSNYGIAIEVPFEEIKYWTHFLRTEEYIN